MDSNFRITKCTFNLTSYIEFGGKGMEVDGFEISKDFGAESLDSDFDLDAGPDCLAQCFIPCESIKKIWLRRLCEAGCVERCSKS